MYYDWGLSNRTGRFSDRNRGAIRTRAVKGFGNFPVDPCSACKKFSWRASYGND